VVQKSSLETRPNASMCSTFYLCHFFLLSKCEQPPNIFF